MQKLKRRIGQFITIIAVSLVLTTAAVPEPVVVQAKTTYVYVTNTGKKYHSTKDCRGLSRAKSVKKVKLKTAKKNYKPCKICY